MTNALALASYGQDRWLDAGGGVDLLSAIDSSVVATMPGAADAAGMLDHARAVGGPALRAMTFAERGRVLRGLAEALTVRKEELRAAGGSRLAVRTQVGWVPRTGVPRRRCG